MGAPSTRSNSITEEELASLKQAFSLYDVNKNGYICLSEFGKIIQGLGFDIGKEAIIKELDENQDGKIDFQEFVQAMNKLISQPLTEEPESVIEVPHNEKLTKTRQMESQHNGKYMRQMSRHEDDELRQCFKRFDKNNDGQISFAELTEVMGELGESLTQEDLKDMMTDADINKDGFIDFEEFKNLIPSS
ncbi:EF-hand [Backusella circina FSU 941]|nr:EF-hand [Backusella circina FSU 941]